MSEQTTHDLVKSSFFSLRKLVREIVYTYKRREVLFDYEQRMERVIKKLEKGLQGEFEELTAREGKAGRPRKE